VFLVKFFSNFSVCTKTIWTTVDILSDVNLCYAGHFQATQDIFRKSKDNKRNLFLRPLIHLCINNHSKSSKNLARLMQLV